MVAAACGSRASLRERREGGEEKVGGASGAVQGGGGGGRSPVGWGEEVVGGGGGLNRGEMRRGGRQKRRKRRIGFGFGPKRLFLVGWLVVLDTFSHSSFEPNLSERVGEFPHFRLIEPNIHESAGAVQYLGAKRWKRRGGLGLALVIHPTMPSGLTLLVTLDLPRIDHPSPSDPNFPTRFDGGYLASRGSCSLLSVKPDDRLSHEFLLHLLL